MDLLPGIEVPAEVKLLEWLAVLSVAGIPYRITRGPRGWTIRVTPEHESEARLVLLEHEKSHQDWPPRLPPDTGGGGSAFGGIKAALWGVYLVGLFYLWLGPYRATVPLLQAAGAQRSAVRAGEWWRTVTALMIHGDIGHLVSNLLFLLVFAALLCRIFGPGLGWMLVLTAGAIGNGWAALSTAREGVGVGASTACFGALGLLAAHGAAVNLRCSASWHEVWRRALMPLGAGLALLSITGTAPGTDLMAHLFGFLAGLVLGAGVAGAGVYEPRTPGVAAQKTLSCTVLAAVALCWFMAWRHSQ